jgi:hypothetical protein
MKPHQSMGKNSQPRLNVDLLGRAFYAGPARMTVSRVRPGNPHQVIIERDIDGKDWALPAGLVRLILDRARTRQTARLG